MTNEATTATGQGAILRKAIASSFLGNFIEWFDYATYSYFASVIALVFFPGLDKAAAVTSAFAVFALGFLMRPLGALFWGSFGDKKGRKWTLSFSILLMADSTFLIGCLPGADSVGAAAPALLLLFRCLQSFSAAGEYAGASTFIAEFAPPAKRGLYVSFVPASTATGLLAGSLFATILFQVFGPASDFMVMWGWRIPFWLALPLGYLTFVIRTHLDSPEYEQMEIMAKYGSERVTHPVRTMLGTYPVTTLVCAASAILNAVGFYAVLTFMPNYLHVTLGCDMAMAGLLTTVVLVFYIGMIFVAGQLSDRFGRKRMLVAAAVGFVLLTVPTFMMLNTEDFFACLLVELFMALLLCVNDGTLASYISEQYPSGIRFTGFAFTFNLSNAVFGGSCSAICFWLIGLTGNQYAPAYYITAVAVVALAAVLASKDHSGLRLSEIEAEH